MAAISLSNFQLGDLLGRGASGSVYRALNFLTGETVAIKSISLLTLAPSSLPDIMSEIDLLKNLNHPNIVKYKGFARDKDNLFIVLEYCENGSLQTILKKFGKFPESLVAVYISQVLEGLIYLHEQGVIHRDIKGANILTNKDGSVKLADFGVSSSTVGPAVEEDDPQVVGSPYWMAPEVIEQSGASSASDIWSVGCVVMELLEGKPPYGDLAPMQALWRIVQDESMRLPDSASPIVKDFLYHCFQKDPNLRVTAKKLLRHPWMVTARKHLDPLRGVPASQLQASSPRFSSRSDSAQTKSVKHSLSKSGAWSGGDTLKAKKPMYDEAVQRVREWNEALNATPKDLGTIRRFAQVNQGHPRKPSVVSAFPSRPSNDSLTAQPASSGTPSPAHASGLLIQKTHLISELLDRVREDPGNSWDDDFASDIPVSRLSHRREESGPNEEQDQKTIRPIQSPAPAFASLPPISSSRSISDTKVEDYSDIAAGEDDSGLASKLANMKLKNKARKAILHPDDLRKVKSLAPSPAPKRSLSSPGESATSVVSHPSHLHPTPDPPRSPTARAFLSAESRHSSTRRSELSESHLELQKYTEVDDEDYSDVFETHGAQNIQNSTVPQSLQLTRRSNKSWHLGDEEENDAHDPFSEIGDDFDGDADDLETNLLRDKWATLCSNISRLVDLLQPSTPAASLIVACDDLLAMLKGSPDLGLESHFVSSHGMLAVLEVLESRISRDVAVRLLKIANAVVSVDVEFLESFCLIGGIPVAIAFTSKKQSVEVRLEASLFVQYLTRSALPLQMFISCRGLRVLVELLDEDYAENKALVLSSLEGIGSVFDLQSPTPRNDFCRMFVREGILDPLSSALLSVLKDSSITEPKPSKRVVDVLLLFCQVAQADARVREAFATRTIVIRLLRACDLLPRKLLITAIKAVKHLSTSPQLIEVLQNSNAMEFLVSLLSKTMKGPQSNEICSHIFQTIYSMCRISKARQEEAASSGIIPLLKRVIQRQSPLKQFALPILCDLANAGKVSRRLLWQNEGLKLYLDLLEDPYWRVSALDAVLVWMQDETARVEDVLLEQSATDSIVQVFIQASGVSFEGILDPLLKILRLSTSLTTSISTTAFFRRLSESLDRNAKAVVKLNLLRLIRVVCDNHPDRATLVSRFDLARIVDRLGKQDDAVLVRELAKELHPSLLFGNDPPMGVVPTRVLNTVKRTTGDSAKSDAMRKQVIGPDREGVEGKTGVSLIIPGKGGENPKHKRKISRSQLSELMWQTDINGRLMTVRTPSNSK